MLGWNFLGISWNGLELMVEVMGVLIGDVVIVVGRMKGVRFEGLDSVSSVMLVGLLKFMVKFLVFILFMLVSRVIIICLVLLILV